MIPLRFIYAGWVITIAVTMGVSAQEPPAAVDPFGAEPAAAAPAAAAPAAARKPVAPEVIETDPNVVAIRESNPRTPFELLRAVQNLMNLGRPDEAKKYLKTLADSKPDQGTLVWLQQTFGSGFFLRLSTDKGMEPDGLPFAQAVLDAAHRHARHPARIAALIKQLSDSSASCNSMK